MKDQEAAYPSMPKTGSFTNSIGMRLVRIEPGTFIMGFGTKPLSDELTGRLAHRRCGDFDEHPSHPVRITKPFYMAACQVTNGQYEQFDPQHRALRGKSFTPYREKRVAELVQKRDQTIALSESDDEAVLFVSWHDASRFCEWLSRKEGLPYRLPTEAEWEYACRAGTTGPFHTGDLPPEGCLAKAQAPYAEEVFGLFVGMTRPNAWGLYDMHGNVEEWCRDWYGPYQANEQVDPIGPSEGDFRVTRGGSHSTEAYFLRSSNRMGTLPEDRNWLIGFRVAMGGLPNTPPSPAHPPQLWQLGVMQTAPGNLVRGPYPSRPIFEGPRKYVMIPGDAKGPLFPDHNHDPALARCPNGDLLAIWYTCVREPGRELALAASRLRRGANEWDPASLFWDAPDRNDHAPALWFNGRDTLYHFNGLSAGPGYRASLALTMRISRDNGVTWSKARLINADRGIPSQPVPGVVHTLEGAIILVSDASHPILGPASLLWISEDDGLSWRPSEGFISGIHAGLVQLGDGRLMALGRGVLQERMPMSISPDMGRTWSYSPSPFPPIGGGQRLVLMRLKEGPIMLCSFTGPRAEPTPMPIRDASGKERLVTGLFAAVSFDEGRTWPRIRPVSDDGPGRLVETMDGIPFTMGFSSAEPGGYLAACQTDDGIIHLISSRQHYAFNFRWLVTPAASEPANA